MWNGKNKAITFSFDDGVESDRKLVNILNQYNLKCTFNLNSGLMECDNPWNYLEFSVKRLTATEMENLYDGHEIAVHGFKHAHFNQLTGNEIGEELKKDKEKLEALFKRNIKGMAYAYGEYGQEVIMEARKQNLYYARTTKSTYNFDIQTNLLEFNPTCHHMDDKVLELARRFVGLETDKPQLFYIWGHSYESDAKNTWPEFKQLCKIISGRNDIFYGTNEQVLDV